MNIDKRIDELGALAAGVLREMLTEFDASGSGPRDGELGVLERVDAATEDDVPDLTIEYMHMSQTLRLAAATGNVRIVVVTALILMAMHDKFAEFDLEAITERLVHETIANARRN